MHEYDTVLKSLLADSKNTLFEQITGARHGRWLNVELPKVAQPRVDLLFQTTRPKRLVALEFQSLNDLWLPVRMAEYSLAVYRVYKIFPEQFVLYVGNKKLRMPSALFSPNLTCRYTLINIADFDAETLLNSSFPADNILAILARTSNKMDVIGRILTRIAKLERPEANAALSKLMLVAGLRRLEDVVRTEAKHMPILNDIMDHKVFGPLIRQGQHEGTLSLLSRQIAERFGPLSPSTKEILSKMSVAELEDVGSRLFRAASPAELFDR